MVNRISSIYQYFTSTLVTTVQTTISKQQSQVLPKSTKPPCWCGISKKNVKWNKQIKINFKWLIFFLTLPSISQMTHDMWFNLVLDSVLPTCLTSFDMGNLIFCVIFFCNILKWVSLTSRIIQGYKVAKLRTQIFATAAFSFLRLDSRS